MGIKLLPNGTYQVSRCKRHPITRKPETIRWRGFKTKTEAQRAYDRLVVELDKKLNAQIYPNWKTIIAEYAQDQQDRGLSLRTVRATNLCLNSYTMKDWGELPINEINKAQILALANKNFSDRPANYQQYLYKCIRGAFNYALEMDYIKANPTPQKKFKSAEKLETVLTEAQASLLLDKAREVKSEWYPIWATALYTGMRSSELYALEWNCVNLENNYIKVCRSWNNKDGFKDTKSGDDRIVEISPALKPILQDLCATSMNDFVLPRLEKWDKGEQARELRTFLMMLGLPRIRFHDLRATWATLLLSKGAEPIKVMKCGGWKDMDTMMRYVRKAGVDIKGIMDNMILHQHTPSMANVIALHS